MAFYTRLSLFGLQGERKYLNRQERLAFYKCAKNLPLENQMFCHLLYFTGARISEILNLTVQHIDFVDKLIVIRSLKKRRKDVYRQIPLPDHLMGSILALVDHKRKIGVVKNDTENLWSFSSRTASRLIKRVMKLSGIEGAKASALGLRHGFAVHAVNTVPLTQVQKWMGHGHLSTTAIYLEVSGIEERKWAEKMWNEGDYFEKRN